MNRIPAVTICVHSILVVDDQDANLQLVGGFLRREGYEVNTANSGPAALECIAARRPDLILLDVRMPGMDGFALCERVRLIPECLDIPVIFLSAAEESGFIIKAFESGGVDYITKPFRKPELIARVRTHLALKTNLDRMIRLLREKDELLGMVAHDLKNPLFAISLTVQTLRNKLPPEASFEARIIDSIESTVKEMSGSIESLLSQQAEEFAEFPLTFQPINLEVALKAAIGSLSRAAADKQSLIETVVPADPVMVMADASALKHLLENLVSNAIKFSPRGSKLTVTAMLQPDGMPACLVTDEGPGLTPDDEAGLFQKYRRLSARPTAGESSTGMGLAIVKMLAERMSGHVTATNREDRSGAVFTLFLPPA